MSDRDIAGSVLIEWPAPHAEVSQACDDADGVHVDSWATVIRDAASGERLTGVNWLRLVCPSSGPVVAVVMSVRGVDGEPLRESQSPSDVLAGWVERWYQVAGMSFAAAPPTMERVRSDG